MRRGADPESGCHYTEILRCAVARHSSRSARPGITKKTLSLRFLRLELLDRTAGIAPGGEAAAHMRDRLQAHVLRGLGRQRRAHAAGAMKDEFLVFLKDRLGIRGRPIN